MGFDPISYAIGKSKCGGGGGVIILSGTTDPAASQGENGQIYLKDVGNPMPGYAGLEYLEVTTAGPYIDTGVVNNSTAYFEVDAQYTSAPRDNHGLFGSMGPAKEFVVSAYGGEAYFEAGSTRGVFTSSATQRHIFEGKSDGLYLDRVLLNPNVNWSNTNELTYYLFAFNYYQSPWIFKTANAKMFGCKLYNGENLVRDFIPVMRLGDSELGMLDLVNSQFYPNNGGGEFIAGPVMSGVSQAYAKVNGAWQNLIGTDISDINLGN